jgi:acyl-CoA synthetase (AMP-forming)/AMP-acid ligase II
MEILHVIGLVIIITALFAIGGKVVIFFKNREIALIREKYEQMLDSTKHEHESVRAALSEDSFKQTKRLEEHYLNKLNEKDRQIQELVNDLETLQNWKKELELKFAKYEGASQGSTQHLVMKLLDHNQKLNEALNAKWKNIEENLSNEFTATLGKIKHMFADAEKLHRDGIEIISEYESRLPDDVKRKVHEEMLKLPQSTIS